MAAKPTEEIHWAVTLQYEAGVAGGLTVTWPNRSSIPTDYQQTGVLLGEDLDRQWLNQALYLTGEWITHLNERYSTGDVIMTASGETAGQVSTRLGGTWIAKGSDTVGTASVDVFEKTA